MARVLGYGGVANTNGARSFSGKAEASSQIESKILGCSNILDITKMSLWALAMGVINAVS